MEAHAYRTGFIIGGIYNASAYGKWYHFHDWVSLSPRASRRAPCRNAQTNDPYAKAESHAIRPCYQLLGADTPATKKSANTYAPPPQNSSADSGT